MPRRHELHTADGVPIDEMLEMVRTAIDKFNDANKPFTDMFADVVSEQTFRQEPDYEDVYWDRRAEGEHPRTMREPDKDDRWVTIRSDEYTKGLGMTQKYVRKTDSSDIINKLQGLLEGAQNTEERLVYNTLQNGISDGTSDVWYEVRDYGEYTFNQDHNHVFPDSQALFGDSNAYAPHEHIEEAKHQLTHHGAGGPFVALVSNQFKRLVRDEISWDASYHIPMANNMRMEDIRDLDIQIDGVGLVESPWMTGNKFYVTQAGGSSPIKLLRDRPVQVNRPNGAVVRSPGDLLGANATAEWGCRMIDPLGAVEVDPDNITNQS